MNFFLENWKVIIGACVVLVVAFKVYVGYSNRSKQSIVAKNNSNAAGRDVNMTNDDKPDNSSKS